MRKSLIHPPSRGGKYATDILVAPPVTWLTILNRAGGDEGWLPVSKLADRRKRGFGVRRSYRWVRVGKVKQHFGPAKLVWRMARQAPEIAFGPEWVGVKQIVVVLRPGARRFTGREGCLHP